jgi:hypothetical protein
MSALTAGFGSNIPSYPKNRLPISTGIAQIDSPGTAVKAGPTLRVLFPPLP